MTRTGLCAEPNSASSFGGRAFAKTWQEARPQISFGWNMAKSAGRYAAVSMLAITQRTWISRRLVGLYAHHLFADQQEKFSGLLDRLQTRGSFVDTETCLRMLEGRTPMTGLHFHLSFDDGVANIHENAFPILHERGIRPAFFIPSAMIGASVSDQADFSCNVLGYGAPVGFVTREQLVELAGAGWTIGSHSRTHRRISSLSATGDELESEIAHSKLEIEDMLGHSCKYFSWPYGGREDIDDNAIENIQAAGYEACFGAFRGSIVAQETDRWRIPRHHFEAHWPHTHVEYFARGNLE